MGGLDASVRESELMLLRATGLVLMAMVFTSCATHQSLAPVALDFFVTASASNPWNQKIQNWQARHEQDPAARADPVPGASGLGQAYRDFTARMRHDVVAQTVAWVQERSREAYRPDGERDHWATLGEVVERGGDDCDGLDLLTFVLLRRMGFREDEIFRSIVVERGTGQHHMVTLWFDGKSPRDPLVLDPTGVVSTGVARLSEVSDWEPIELFDERAHFAVGTLRSPGAARHEVTGSQP